MTAAPAATIPAPAAASPLVELGDTNGGAGGSKSKLWFIVAGVAVVALLAVGAFVLFSGGDDEGAVASGSDYRGPNTDLLLLSGYTSDESIDETTFAVYGSSERPTELTDGFFNSARLPGPNAPSLASVGGPLIGSITQDGEAMVITVDRGTGEVTELLDGGSDYNVVFDPSSNSLQVVEYRDSSGSRCYAGPLNAELRRVARGDDCTFSPSGRYVLSQSFDDDGTNSFEVVDRDERVITSGESAQYASFLPDERYLLSFNGSNDQMSAVITDLETTELVTESTRASSVSVLDVNAASSVLVASHDGDGAAFLEVISPNAEPREITSNEGPISASLLNGTNDDVLVVTANADGAIASIARRVLRRCRGRPRRTWHSRHLPSLDGVESGR